ncbi:hypothetical protein [Streptomyces sp. TLI_053]|uniref:hypothetical protein n=1 Tax=Streptomyces sp. TLI_053 TaxID=1855352 RepID=UPI000B87C029|nr:hypothetical protein [Streptomyces sp. TLI_053]
MAPVEGVPDDHADVRAVGDVPHAQHPTAQQVLYDDGQAAAVGAADPGGGARLPAPLGPRTTTSTVPVLPVPAPAPP